MLCRKTGGNGERGKGLLHKLVIGLFEQGVQESGEIMVNEIDGVKELYPGIYWVGDCDQKNGLNCNPYLIIDGDEAVLIDPGSTLDFEQVLKNVASLIPLEKVRYVVLQHQDPDLCSSMPLFEAKGLQAQIATHWRASLLIRYYGVKSSFYIVGENEYKLTFGSGRTLHFYLTPYLHFPGAIVTYDPLSKILFSSDLFGAFTRNWSFFADEMNTDGFDHYIEAMKTFHENYMPGNDILRPVMEKLLTVDINMIAPQHGSIIRRDIPKYIKVLRDLECGTFLNPIKKELAKIDGFTGLCNQVLKRYYSTFSHEEVAAVFSGTHIQLEPPTGLIADYSCTGRELWQELFQLIYSRKGASWLGFIEPYITKLVKEYELEMPAAFVVSLMSAERDKEVLNESNTRLAAINQRLEQSLEKANEALLKCPLTKLSNEKVFRAYLQAACQDFSGRQPEGALLFIAIDNMAKLNQAYGVELGDEIIKAVAYVLEAEKHADHFLFKLDGPVFAYYMEGISARSALEIAMQLRNHIEKSEASLQRITVSIGFVALAEQQALPPEQRADWLFKTAKLRETIARSRGGNLICQETPTGLEELNVAASILLVDTDEMNLAVLKNSLERMHYKVATATDGISALQIISEENPEVVICEAMIPQLDGFALREKMQLILPANRSLFILLSHQKDSDSIKHALSLGITHFFKKPYFLTEIIGIVNQHFRQR